MAAPRSIDTHQAGHALPAHGRVNRPAAEHHGTLTCRHGPQNLASSPLAFTATWRSRLRTPGARVAARLGSQGRLGAPAARRPPQRRKPHRAAPRPPAPAAATAARSCPPTLRSARAACQLPCPAARAFACTSRDATGATPRNAPLPLLFRSISTHPPVSVNTTLYLRTGKAAELLPPYGDLNLTLTLSI